METSPASQVPVVLQKPKRVRIWTPEQKLARAAYEKSRPKRVLTTEQRKAASKRGRAWALANPDRAAEVQKNWQDKNVSEIKATSAAWYAANKSRKAAQSAAWMEANPGRASELAATRYLLNKPSFNLKSAEWRRLNPATVLDIKVKRRVAQMNRSPKWDQELTEFVSAEAYRLSESRNLATGFKWHVDHVIPLQGKRVSGLHSWSNLAVIPATLNLQKNNRFAVA